MPTIDKRPFKPSTTNIQILNAIRNESSSLYQSRIPAVTKANVQEAIRDLMGYTPTRNEFIEGFINKIGMTIGRNLQFTNPLAKFKIGKLEFGESIEEYNVGLIVGYDYDADRESLERTLFGTHAPDVAVIYHKRNRRQYYPITLNREQLKAAFQSETGLSALATSIMAAPVTSDQVDEFELMCSLFAEYYKAGGFFKVNVPDVSNVNSTEADAKALLRQTRTLAKLLPFPSRYYNASKRLVTTSVDKLELFVTPEADAAMDVEALAAAFNVDYATMPSRKTVIPKEKFGIPGVQAILTTNDFFVVADTEYEMTSQPNAATMGTNYFLHHWQIMSASLYVPAILLWTGPGDTTEEIETPVVDVADLYALDRTGTTVTTLPRGDMYYIVGAAVTSPENGPNDAVRFQLTGNNSPLTYMAGNMVHVGADETATSLTVKAFAVDDNAFTETITFPLSGDILTIWPATDYAADGDKLVTPKKPGKNGNKLSIPSIDGVTYKNGATTVTDDVTITQNTTITASANAGYEFPENATVSWVFNFTA